MNLYLHFPFCRSKCAYCALHSYVGRSEEDRRNYVSGIIRQLGNSKLKTQNFPPSTSVAARLPSATSSPCSISSPPISHPLNQKPETRNQKL